MIKQIDMIDMRCPELQDIASIENYEQICSVITKNDHENLTEMSC